MSWTRLPLALLAAAAIAGAPQYASASSTTVTDPTDQTDHPRDIASISHGHAAEETQVLEHAITFDGSPDSIAGAVDLHFRFTTKSGSAGRRLLSLEASDDGSLYGTFTRRDGTVVGFARAWMEDPSTLLIQFTKDDFGARRLHSYRWFVWSFLEVGEFDTPCAAEDTGPPTCQDRAPAEGTLTHDLRD